MSGGGVPPDDSNPNDPGSKKKMGQDPAIDADATADSLRPMKVDEGHKLDESPTIDAVPKIGDGTTLDATADWQSAKIAGGTERASGGVTGARSIGPYRLLRKLGEGGMGQVWLARQEKPVERLVALKLIRVGIYDDSVIRRFQSERQSLAIMNHPSIAKVFDAGTTSDGQPFFVMEYVDGLPVSEYCDKHRLRIRERLELFVKICEAVQHAHQKAIIHRDLKPANILVEEVDGNPTPRIIDFGLAKAVAGAAAGVSLFTQGIGFVGTPGYMSPEQANPAGLDVDTRTDVYSLGVVLYLLLSGSLPFDREKWRNRPMHEAMRELYEEEPPPPSAKIGGDKRLAAAAEERGTQSGHLPSLIRGDLDWITMRALERDRERRYGTPSELAADIRRYLQNEPVVARPATTAYRMRKYVRRHRVGVAIAAGLALLLVGFAGVQAEELKRITRERDRANRITEFITEMFKVSDPSEARGNSVTAREILDRASRNIESGLATDPEERAQLMRVMGTVYTGLGLYSESESLLNRAIAIQAKSLGLDNPETLQSETALGQALLGAGKNEDAEKLLRQTLETARRSYGPKDARTIESMNDLALALLEEGRAKDAEGLLKEANETAKTVLGPDDPNRIRYEGNLASVLSDLGSFEEAEKLQREMLAACIKTFGPDHPTTLDEMTNLAVTVSQEGRFAESEGIYRQLIQIQRRVLGPEHPATLRSISNMAGTINDQGRYEEAERMERDLIEVQRRALGPEHPETLATMDNLVNTLAGEKRYAEAEKLQLQLLNIDRRLYGASDPETASSIYNLACVKAQAGQREEAIALLRESLDSGLSPRTAGGIGEDDDLGSLRGDARFVALASEGRQRAELARKAE